MAGKKRANKAYIPNPEKTQYDGFVDDMKDIYDMTQELELETRINDIHDELVQMKDAIVVPEGDASPETQKLNMKKASLTALIDQLDQIKEFAHEYIVNQAGKGSALNSLMNWKNYDPDKDIVKFNENEYGESIRILKDYAKTAGKLFSSTNAGIPQNIKRHLDDFNLMDDFESFAGENTLLGKVDQILNDTFKLYTKTMRINSQVRRHDAVVKIEKGVCYDKQNLEAYGKAAFEMPEFSMKNIGNAYTKASKEWNKAMTARDEAKEKRDKAKEEYDKWGLEYAQVLTQGKVDEKKKENAIKAYNDYKVIHDRVAEAKTGLDEALKNHPIPDHKEFQKASNATYKTGDDLIKEKLADIEAFSGNQAISAEKLGKNNSNIQKMVKAIGDTKLEEYAKSEARKMGYLRYPVYGRRIFELMKSLPEEYSIGIEVFNIIQINKEIDNKIEQNVGKKEIWYTLKVMLENAKNLAPDDMITKPFNEDSFKYCEDMAPKMISAINEDEYHKLRNSTVEDLKAKIAGLNDELKAMEKAYKKNKPKDKAAKEQYKLKYETEKAAKLEEIKKAEEDLEAYPQFVKDTAKLQELINDTAALYDENYSYKASQLDIYIGCYNQGKANKDDHDKLVRAERDSLYGQFKDLYDAIPDNIYSNKDNPNRTKDQTPLKEALDGMRYAPNDVEFAKNHVAFVNLVRSLKNDFSDKNVAFSKSKLEKLENEMKRFDVADRLVELKAKLDVAERDYNEKQLDYETKRDAFDRCNRNLDSATQTLANAAQYYDKKEKAERFDPNNELQAGLKEDVDQNGDTYFMRMRQPFNHYYARKDYAKGRFHSNSTEFKEMIEKLEDIVNLSDNSTMEEYREAVRQLQQKVTTYITKKENQTFKSKKSKIRKFRLSFAKSLATLCEQQLDTVKPSDREVTLNIEVLGYLNRNETLPPAQEMDNEQKKAARQEYNDSLDARRQEAIEAYKKSATYKAKQAVEEEEFSAKVDSIDKEIANAENIKASGNQVMINGFNIIHNKGALSIDETIEKIKQRKKELIKNFQEKQILKQLEDTNITQNERERLEAMLQNVREDKAYNLDEKVNIIGEEKNEEIINAQPNNIIIENGNNNNIIEEPKFDTQNKKNIIEENN